MSDTGRIKAPIGLRTQRQIYGEPTPAEIAEELDRTTLVDLAHVIMLRERGLIAPEAAVALVTLIEQLRDSRFAALATARLPRGLYLAYEQYLTAELGEDVGGVLHTGRSRNDMKATITLTRLREWLLAFLQETTRLVAVLLSRGREYRDVVMPVHTHYQAAMPITYGYYLTGVAAGLTREIESAWDSARGLRRCPMGAGAVAGSDLPIDPARVAALLGFEEPPVHALDAIASRDVTLRLLADATGVAVVLSRLGTDLQLWSTEEFGFIQFPDRLVGGSSAMPQKRNAFLLEHVTAAVGRVSSSWVGAVTAMKGAPFTNSIEVGTEAVGLAWPGLRAATDVVQLGQVLVSGARPRPGRMRQRAVEGITTATAVANRLVQDGMPFRVAHHTVGAAIREQLAEADGEPTGVDWMAQRFPAAAKVADPAVAVSLTDAGGGPGDWQRGYDDVYGRLRVLRDRSQRESARLGDARAELDSAVRELRYGTTTANQQKEDRWTPRG
ncbi:argininosuccinate lyase [Verrucosispora sp. WMMD573]|uniref:argininosuccinate lyase n=1 Tax=Verrucosispora sp. WMMD573 TaxID=3015149 RepID=UPI00248D191A|nr:argininosuccinate lyase [Verrucosispora sp. WMMD573]WBB53626.1 argininosuccinate lyase [Verrucosispora sp. WMMD573]